MKDSTVRRIDTEMARSVRRVESGDLPWCMQDPRRSNDEKSRVIAEECSEVVFAAGRHDVTKRDYTQQDLRAELTQVASTAIAWLESLG